MRLIVMYLIVAGLGACQTAVTDGGDVAAVSRGGTLGRYIVVLEPARVGRHQVEPIGRSIAQAHGGTLGHVYQHALRGFSVTLPAQAASALAHDPRVKYVQPDRRVSITSTETASTWGLDRIDQRDLPGDGTYGFDASGRAVNIYVLDTGISTTHRELVGRATSAASAIVYDGWELDDCHGHGTHVAATAAGSVHGVAKSANVHSVRVLWCDGFGDTSDVLWGVDWVTAHHVKPAIANMSLVSSPDPALDEAIQGSIAAGVIYAVAAANYNEDACDWSPARVPEAITVGATNALDERASFSNWGACVDLFAPGEDIPSATKNGDDSYENKSGTSMATPHVAGAAALYLEQFPTATPATVAAALVSNASANKLTLNATNTPNLLLYSGFIATSSDATAPAIAITSPAAQATLAAQATVTVSASDDDAVARVELYASGALIGASTSAPFTVTWDSTRTANGTAQLVARAIDRSGNRTDSAAVAVTISNTTQAAYDALLAAPACHTVERACDSFALADGRASHEPSTPNTIASSCLDGDAGIYHADESVDRIRVVSLDGGPLASGKLVEVEMDLWSAGAHESDGTVAISGYRLYYAADAQNPQWVEIPNAWPTQSYKSETAWADAYQRLARRYVLPAGALQAVRVIIERGSPQSACTTTLQRDIDDLVFAVGEGDGSPVCGNSVVEPGEDCDGSNLDGETCVTRGWYQGFLRCTSSCTFDEGWCWPAPVCGNGIIETGEECDGTNMGGYGCIDFGFPESGELTCNPDCTRNFAGCSGAECGNQVRESGEQCDGTDLGGETCTTQGFTSGTLDCSASCTYDTGDCAGACIPPGSGKPCTSSTLCCSGTGNCSGGSPSQRTCL